MIKNNKVYVTMNDKFMSGWGEAENKINKLVIECDTMEEAQIVSDNARERGEMKYINIATKKPSYNTNKYFVSFKTKETYKAWFVKDAFKNQIDGGTK